MAHCVQMEKWFFTKKFCENGKEFFFTCVWPMIFLVMYSKWTKFRSTILIDNGGHIISRATFVSLKALLQCFFKDMRGGMNWFSSNVVYGSDDVKSGVVEKNLDSLFYEQASSSSKFVTLYTSSFFRVWNKRSTKDNSA